MVGCVAARKATIESSSEERTDPPLSLGGFPSLPDILSTKLRNTTIKSGYLISYLYLRIATARCRSTHDSWRTEEGIRAHALALVWVPHDDVPSPWDMIMMPTVR
jgi:hypothetical protein